MTKNLIIYTDGGARGNPGPAAIGVYVVDSDGKEILRKSKQIGEATNNIAEYRAVIEALEWIKKNFQSTSKVSDLNFQFYLDSSLVVNQLNGIFKVKQSHLRDLLLQVRKLEQEIGGKILYNFIPREKNKTADFLVNNSF
ncbi:ribonuclease H [Candidatus Shapirobacteria bacterium CG07_land_8_20_14_0_80_39_18]|uniref:Ribonuclease H n=1 Tax=Candidatus Shapirobacteria bacterium CG07_land_8_20_14_0_80_39_18 TaxID=1974882 RepID=A0A2M6YRE1_9BACT|nr:MAG: ribonuclease H [Candidatus Shapirobacteria bacterium CG07_land_8_20_14_0_80_39_18]